MRRGVQLVQLSSRFRVARNVASLATTLGHAQKIQLN
jgi:hypothetical protein